MQRNRGWRIGAAASIIAIAGVIGWRLLAQPAPSDVMFRARSDACRTAASPSIRLLAEIRNTRDDNFDCLGVVLGHGVMRALHIESHSFSMDGALGQIEHIKTIEIATADIERDEGVVLDGALGHDAILLRGRMSPDYRHARLETAFLYNGFTGEYRRCAIAIDGDGDNWRLVDVADRPVRQIVIRTRQLPFLGTVGIANLDGLCPD